MPKDELNDRAVIGDNRPPPYDVMALARLDLRVTEFVSASELWLRTPIADDEQSSLLTDQISGVRQLYKESDGQRAEAKKPHDEAGKAVQAAYAPLLTRLELCGNKLKAHQKPYIERREQEERDRKAREAREAAEKAEAARLAAAEAAAAGRIEDEVRAAADLKEAEKAQKVAARPASTASRSASGAGRATSLRNVKTCRMKNARLAFLHYQDRPEVHDLLLRLATAEARSAGFPENGTIPGIEIVTERVVA